MKPSQILQSHCVAVLRMAARPGARSVRVSGLVLQGKNTADGDVDLVADVPRGATFLDGARLPNALTKEIGVSADVLTALDLPRKFREQVVREARAS